MNPDLYAIMILIQATALNQPTEFRRDAVTLAYWILKEELYGDIYGEDDATVLKANQELCQYEQEELTKKLIALVKDAIDTYGEADGARIAARKLRGE